jgi:LysM repeat protein
MTRRMPLHIFVLVAVCMTVFACQMLPLGLKVLPTATPETAVTEKVIVPTDTSVAPTATPAPTETPIPPTPEPTPTEPPAPDTSLATPAETPTPVPAESTSSASAATEPVETAVAPSTVPIAVQPVYHVVQQGENLFRIGLRYGLTARDVALANGIADTNRIWAGTKLVIPVLASLVPHTHAVIPGDTLYSLARRFGTTVWAIAQANGIRNVNNIRVGQVLLIPPTVPGTTLDPMLRIYVVQWGDTLSGIAWRFGTSVAAVARANAIVNPDVIYVGQQLYILW